MARYYMALGPFDSRDAAEHARSGLTESDALRACVLRLADRTGPSLRERAGLRDKGDAEVMFRIWENHTKRLAALEAAPGEPMCIGCGKTIAEHPDVDASDGVCAFPSVAERLELLTNDILDLRTRIGDLEREPAPVRPEADDESPISEAARKGPLELDIAPADPDRLAR